MSSGLRTDRKGFPVGLRRFCSRVCLSPQSPSLAQRRPGGQARLHEAVTQAQVGQAAYFSLGSLPCHARCSDEKRGRTLCQEKKNRESMYTTGERETEVDRAVYWTGKPSAPVRKQGVASRVMGDLQEWCPVLLRPWIDSLPSSGIHNKSRRRTGESSTQHTKVIRVRRDKLPSQGEGHTSAQPGEKTAEIRFSDHLRI